MHRRIYRDGVMRELVPAFDRSAPLAVPAYLIQPELVYISGTIIRPVIISPVTVFKFGGQESSEKRFFRF